MCDQTVNRSCNNHKGQVSARRLRGRLRSLICRLQQCPASMWLPLSLLLPRLISQEFCLQVSSPSASVCLSSRSVGGVETAAQFASRLQELLQPNLAQAALAGDQLVGKFDSAQQASSLDVRVSPPESLVMQPFRRRRLAVGGLPAQQQCNLQLEGAIPHFLCPQRSLRR